MHQSKREKRKKLMAGIVAGVLIVGMLFTVVVSAFWGV